MEVTVGPLPSRPVESLSFEVVERKGVGHPDTLCDAIAERASAHYSRYCLSTFGALAHHWFDKVLLVGGEASISFGQGELVRGYTVVFAGKAAFHVGAEEIPLEKLLRGAAAEVLSESLYGFDPAKHLSVDIRIVDSRGPGQSRSRYHPCSAMELAVPGAKGQVSNDGCVCTAFAPFTPLEDLVLNVERELASEAFKSRNRDTGYDIKVVGVRSERSYSLSVNLPFIATLVPSRLRYLERVAEVEASLREQATVIAGLDVAVVVNPEKVSGRSYLTVTGSVADTGDVGVVGRGNRANGLITPMRPMSIEAAAGKNPVDHAGKIYSAFAQRLASDIADLSQTGTEVYVVTTKERPITDPEHVVVLAGTNGDSVRHRRAITAAAKSAIGRCGELTHEFVDGVVLW